ncbi:MAG: c-type cytochrome biogenesis protein CcmI [Gammaproteobacteria bacterium]|nr:c-type cytochrome biogenesis protein CcmI [Gammaproteobacteria bacterium]
MFSVVATLLCITAIALVAYPLWRRTDDAGPEQAMLHAAVLDSQRRELEQDLAEGLIDEEQFQRARAELAREAPDARATGKKTPRVGRSLATATAVAIFLPAVASAIYNEVGTDQYASSMGKGMDADFGEMIAGLQARLDANPSDPAGWTLLARSYFSIGQAEQALSTYLRALDRGVENASLYAQYADLLASRQQGFAGEPDRLLEKALKLEPDNAHALWLAATSAQDKGAFDRALSHWEHLYRVLDPATEDAAVVAENLRAARKRVNMDRPR